MKWNSFYPVLMTKEIQRSKEFYMDYLGYSISFEADWYVSLINTQTNSELALLNTNHESIPKGFDKSVQGLLVDIEVDDVDTIYQKLIVENKLPVELDIRNEVFGQRHFIIKDPNNILIDIIEVIPADESYTKQYNNDNQGEY